MPIADSIAEKVTQQESLLTHRLLNITYQTASKTPPRVSESR